MLPIAMLSLFSNLKRGYSAGISTLGNLRAWRERRVALGVSQDLTVPHGDRTSQDTPCCKSIAAHYSDCSGIFLT